MTQSVEPSGGGVTSNATLTYGYYPDGSRSALSVQSAMLTRLPLFTYNYRADGLQKQLTVNNGGTQSFSKTFTPAGRPLTKTDPFTGSTVVTSAPYPSSTAIALAPETYSYNGVGQVASLELPMNGTYANFSYDAESEATAFTGYGPNALNGQNFQNARTYTARGELGASNGAGATSAFKFANGFACSNNTNAHDFCSAKTFNAFDSVLMSTSVACVPPNPTVTTWGRDAAGRGNSEIATSCNPYSMTRTFDAENHQLSQSNNHETGGAQTMAWGPNDHPIFHENVTAGQNYNETLHWDGDALLFVTTGDGVDDIKVGTDADELANGQTVVWDRDMNGYVASSHTASGFLGWAPPDLLENQMSSDNIRQNYPPSSAAFQSNFFPHTSQASYPAPNLVSLKPDGYSDGTVSIQGVRTYDSTSASWTAPDAYAGATNDPMSQKAFMWNNNNPVSYSDPSGYCPRSPTNKDLLGDASCTIGTVSSHSAPKSFGINGIGMASVNAGGRGTLWRAIEIPERDDLAASGGRFKIPYGGAEQKGFFQTYDEMMNFVTRARKLGWGPDYFAQKVSAPASVIKSVPRVQIMGEGEGLLFNDGALQSVRVEGEPIPIELPVEIPIP